MPTYMALVSIVVILILLLFSDTKGRKREVEISDAILSPEDLKNHAIGIARNQIVKRSSRGLNWLILRMNSNYKLILDAYRVLNQDIQRDLFVPPAAEWLLDNFYVVEEEFNDIKQNMLKRNLADLPVLKTGYLKGYPRVFAIALEIVSHTDGRLDENTLSCFIEAYQTQKVLSSEELWALAIMMRISLIEKLRQISAKMLETRKQWRKAENIEGLMGRNDSKVKEEVLWFIREYFKNGGKKYSSFIEHLVKRLKRQGDKALPLIRFIDENLRDQGCKSEDIITFEHQIQASLQVSIGNSLTSLKFVQSVNWNEVFETLSYVESILKKDPEEVYTKMDFESKNHYRNAVNRLARRSGVSEMLVAIKALEYAKESKTHIGYYILGDGKTQLLKRVTYKKVEKFSLEETIKKSPHLFYFGTMIFITVLVLSLSIYYSRYLLNKLDLGSGIYHTLVLLATLFSIIPTTEIAVPLTNFIINRICRPSFLPKLELEAGIPEEYGTMIIVPTLLPNENRVRELVEQLEVHYLSNKEENLYFALVGDFKDAPSKILPEDERIIEEAVRGINELNNKYVRDSKYKRFFFFHRERQYNRVQERWMGWERKRGAIIEVNDLLKGSSGTSYKVISCAPTELPKVKYIITLDADTKLPGGAAKKLVGTLAHPMNSPVINEEKGIVTSGYGILQPRISISIISSNISPFTRIFAGQGGMDLYTTAVSDTYQDLFEEGIFTGKGIYDLEVFQSILRQAIPENSILSHDLLEGCYIRAGLVTDVELIDGYPSRYNSFSMRLHRWVRGDWQLAPWLGTKIKDNKGNIIKNPLSAISKWKIMDNMRRSLIDPSLLLLIIFGMFLPVKVGLIWIGLAAAAILIHVIIQLVFNLFTGSYFKYRQGKYKKGISPLKAGLYQALLRFVFIPYQAYMMLDAVVRTVIRLSFTGKNMLEWVTAADMEASLTNDRRGFWKRMWISSFVGGALLLAKLIFNLGFTLKLMSRFTPGFFPRSALTSTSKFDLAFNLAFVLIYSAFLVPWIISFYVAYKISIPYKKDMKKLNDDDVMLLRMISRRTWAYFEDLVTKKDNYLPPDNYQIEPYKGVAHRTSPTNIGIMMTSVISANDLGYIGFEETGMRLDKTIGVIEKMEKWEGHLYNWYNTNTLKILRPAYISTVDSGNFAGYLMVVKQALKDYLNQNIIDINRVIGLKDTLYLLKEEIESSEIADKEDYNIVYMEDKLEDYIAKNLECEVIDIGSLRKMLEELIQFMEKSTSRLVSCRGLRESLWWNRLFEMTLKCKNEISYLLPLCKISIYSYYSTNLQGNEREFTEKLLFKYLKNLKSEDTKLIKLPTLCNHILKEIEEYTNNNSRMFKQNTDFGGFLINLSEDIKSAKKGAEDIISMYISLSERIRILLANIQFTALYDKKRQLFYIGYDVEKNRYSKAHYDLLASEARQTSFIAAARGEIEQKHWFKLGRRLTMNGDYRGLVSWTGTMFEYLMPLLIMRNYDNTLMDETYDFVIRTQKKYGNKHNIPWGVSESAYYAFDINLNYQYKAFGVPELGLKRGLVNDVVVAPYASLLALTLEPEGTICNLRSLIRKGLYGLYGLYEAVDYTHLRLASGREKALVKCFMAHHQGMNILALNNFLNDNIMQKRFHKDPQVKSAELLLQERVPYKVILTKGYKVKLVPAKRVLMEGSRVIRRYGMPDREFPHMHVLSNGKYSTVITDRGSGYSQYNDISVTRWYGNLQAPGGIFVYIRDSESNKIWSTTFEPSKIKPDKYRVVFSPDKGEFIRQDNNIETRTEIIISTEDNSEIRRISLTNYHNKAITIETTSYVEIVLTHRDTDRAHPAFSKLFLITEFNPQYNCLLAERRPKSYKDKSIWALHMVTLENEMAGNIQYETDRGKFIGRTRDLSDPQVLEPDQPLTNSVGSVLDPIMSIRNRIKIESGKTVRISYLTAVCETREEALELADKYSQVKSVERAFELAWTRSQIESGYLGFKSDEINFYLKMLPHILIAGPNRRRWEDIILKNKMDQSALWAYGISGDIPIILLIIDKKEDVEVVYKLIKGHEYWYMRGIEVDLVIIVEEEGGYLQSLHNLITDAVVSSHAKELLGRKGGVFIVIKNQITDDDMTLLYGASRIVFRSNLGPLEEQLEWGNEERERHMKKVGLIPPVLTNGDIWAGEDSSLSFDESHLKFFNGLGGIDKIRKEYVIYMKNRQSTPAPWINVISNKDFGFTISESGGGYTWAENSRENKLTPWSNDPIIDRTGEVIYIRDDKKGKYWNITPMPVRSLKGYLIRHGKGYTIFEYSEEGINQKLIQFVPIKEQIKISFVTLENTLSVEKELSLFYYIKPVLGIHETNTLQFITTEIESKTGILTIRNPFNSEFRDRIVFLDSSIAKSYYTGDNMEFIGIGGSLKEPEALGRKTLSGTIGAGLYPCGAIQVNIKLGPGETKELAFLLGQGEDIKSIQALSEKYRIIDNIKKELNEIKELWDKQLEVLQVDTPDDAMNEMLNGWLLYQLISCRLWARSAFYQSGGAYGFRDQLQDVMALIYSCPEVTRDQIILHASRQFIEGDVQHWWHRETGKGIRSRYSDDLLWLAYVTKDYINCTEDWNILDEKVHYLEGKILDQDTSESYDLPKISETTGTVYEHCTKAIDRALKFGAHGIPLIGSGDWNDGMNMVGDKGMGESVWLGWFLCTIMEGFIPICERMKDGERAREYKKQISEIKEAIEQNAWDGSWYIRAFFDDGTPLGSAQNKECRIDSIAQSWAVISGMGDKSRTKEAMNAVENHLVNKDEGIIKLFSPPFDKGEMEPGYIKGYNPGVRENGGQYTHAACWVIMAMAKMGEGDKAHELFSMINPINHSSSHIETARYKTEPYVLAADVYTTHPNVGRGGWTWYTGAAGWMYRVGIEHILGIKKRGESIVIDPCIPANWKEYNVEYKFGNTNYKIRIKNPWGINRGRTEVTLDGKRVASNKIELKDDGKTHNIEAILENISSSPQV